MTTTFLYAAGFPLPTTGAQHGKTPEQFQHQHFRKNPAFAGFFEIHSYFRGMRPSQLTVVVSTSKGKILLKTI